MASQLLYRGLQGIIQPQSTLMGREIKDDGTLGAEFAFPVGVAFEVKQFDFYRKGIIVTALGKDCFVSFGADLFTVGFPLIDNVNHAVDAVSLVNTDKKDNTDKIKFISFCAGTLFGIVIILITTALAVLSSSVLH